MTVAVQTERMRAGYLIAPGEIVVRDEAIPKPPAGGVLVRVRAALTDGTDLKAFRRGHPQMPMPTRFGHEFSGDVVALGEGVSNFAAGDPIMCVHSAPCAACPWCRDGQEHLCERVMETKILGAYADYVAVPQHIVTRNAFPKPAHVSYEAAAFLEPLACVVHSFDLLALRPCSHVVVIGDGGFGILHALAARALLGDEAILIGRRRERLALAAELGLEHVVDARDFDEAELVEHVRRATGGRGADAVIECTGTKSVWESAPAYARRGGSVALFGGLPAGTRVEFDATRLHYDEIRLLSPFHFSPAAVRRAYGLLVRGEIDVVPLISARFELARLPEAFASLDAGDGVKYLIAP